MFRLWFATTSVLLFTIGAQAKPNQYLCVTEDGVGFRYDKKTDKWQPFPPQTGSKFIFRRLNVEDLKILRDQYYWIEIDKAASWGFFIFGTTDIPIATCVEDGPAMTCRPTANISAQIDVEKSLRFEVVQSGGWNDQGYWKKVWEQDGPPRPGTYKPGRAPDPSRPADIWVVVGTCSQF